MSESTKTVSFTLGKHDRGFISDMVEMAALVIERKL